MNTHDLVVLILGIVSSISMVISAIAIRRPRLLLFAFITSVLCTVQYGMTAAMIGMAICAIGAMRNMWLLIGTKHNKLNHWGFLVAFLALALGAYGLLNDWSNFSMLQALPVLGAVTGTVAVFLQNVRWTKIGLIVTSGLWIVYEYHSALYGQMLGEAFTIVGNAIALAVLVAGSRKGIADENIETVEEQFTKAITTSIPVITGKIAQIREDTKTKPLPVINGSH
jgi:hypothetical protein